LAVTETNRRTPCAGWPALTSTLLIGWRSAATRGQQKLPSSFSAELRQRSAEEKGIKRRRTEQQSKEKRMFVCHLADDEPKQATGKEHLSQPT
jgi:hypothetical protein